MMEECLTRQEVYQLITITFLTLSGLIGLVCVYIMGFLHGKSKGQAEVMG